MIQLLPFLLLPSVVAAPNCDPQDPQSCVTILMEGDTAPFSGQLLTHRRAAKLVVLAEGCQARLDLKIQELREISDIRLRGEAAKRENDQQHFQLKLDLLQKALSEAQNASVRRWYEHPLVWVGVGAAGALGAILVGVRVVEVR